MCLIFSLSLRLHFLFFFSIVVFFAYFVLLRLLLCLLPFLLRFAFFFCTCSAAQAETCRILKTHCGTNEYICGLQPDQNVRCCKAPVCDFALEYETEPLTATTSRVCALLQTCNSSQFVSKLPTATTDRSCAACAPGSFSDLDNAPECTPVRQCELAQTYTCLDATAVHDAKCCPLTDCANADEVISATATSDRVCFCRDETVPCAEGVLPPCPAGNYLDAQLHCQPCPANQFSIQPNLWSCQTANSSCPAGTEDDGIDPTAGRTCRACVDSFTPLAGAACRPFRACPPNSTAVLFSGNSTHDRECLSCSGECLHNGECALQPTWWHGDNDTPRGCVCPAGYTGTRCQFAVGLPTVCPRYAKEREPCSITDPTGPFCAAGLFCQATGFCAKYGGVQDPCGSDRPCAPGLSCHGGWCVPPTLLDNPCDQNACQNEMFCQTAANGAQTCGYKLAADRPCSSSAACRTSFCNRTQGTCAVLDSNTSCAQAGTPAGCEQGTCLATNNTCFRCLREGEQYCRADSDCLPHLFCNTAFGDQACRPRKANGAVCSCAPDTLATCASRECECGLCLHGVCRPATLCPSVPADFHMASLQVRAMGMPYVSIDSYAMRKQLLALASQHSSATVRALALPDLLVGFARDACSANVTGSFAVHVASARDVATMETFLRGAVLQGALLDSLRDINTAYLSLSFVPYDPPGLPPTCAYDNTGSTTTRVISTTLSNKPTIIGTDTTTSTSAGTAAPTATTTQTGPSADLTGTDKKGGLSATTVGLVASVLVVSVVAIMAVAVLMRSRRKGRVGLGPTTFDNPAFNADVGYSHFENELAMPELSTSEPAQHTDC